jgi:hypothetical protein
VPVFDETQIEMHYVDFQPGSMGLRAGVFALPDRRHDAAVRLQGQRASGHDDHHQRQGGFRAHRHQAQGGEVGGGQRSEHRRAAASTQRQQCGRAEVQFGDRRQQWSPHLKARACEYKITKLCPFVAASRLIYSPNT